MVRHVIGELDSGDVLFIDDQGDTDLDFPVDSAPRPFSAADHRQSQGFGFNGQIRRLTLRADGVDALADLVATHLQGREGNSWAVAAGDGDSNFAERDQLALEDDEGDDASLTPILIGFPNLVGDQAGQIPEGTAIAGPNSS